MSRLKHGHCAGARGRTRRSREYNSYRSMLDRCLKPTSAAWKYYGGRGITISAEWIGEGGFERFLSFMEPRPEATTLDRIDPSGNYQPGNLRWANKFVQANNVRPESKAARVANGSRMRERRLRRMAHGALRRYGRLLGFRATERLMSDIRDALEERFGPPAPMPVPREMLCIEEAFIAGDFSMKSTYYDGLERLGETTQGHGTWDQLTRRAA